MPRTLSRTLAGGVLTALIAAVAHPAAAQQNALSERVMELTRATQWKKVAEIPVGFDTFHPQGMVKIGDDFYVSSVEITKRTTKYDTPRDGYDRDTGEGQGHLFKIGPDGRRLADLEIGEGTMFHPGGMDFDGTALWVPAAEYRPNSRSLVYRVDPKAMTAEKVFEYGDHIGGLVHDTDTDTLHGVSWGSRRFYAWPLDGDGQPTNAQTPPEELRVANPAQYIDYQDCHYAGQDRMLCSGLNAYRTAPDATPFQLGGFELVDLKDNGPVWQVPIELWAPSGRPMTQNPFFVETTAKGLRAYFMPDDEKSTIYVFEEDGRASK